MNLADCYRLLGLRTGASFDEIKASYRRLVRQYHPDANPEDPQQAKEKFIQLTAAYRQLMDTVQPSTPQAAPKPSEPVRPPTTSTPNSTPPKVTVKRKSPPIERTPDLSKTDQQLKTSSYEQLQTLLRGRRFPRAIALVEGLAQRLPNDREVRQWQAIAYQQWGRYLISQNESDKARIYLKKALRTDPHNRSLWYEVERDFRRIEQIEML